MKRMLTAVLLLTAFNVGAFAQKVDVAAELRAMVAAERAFAQMAARDGVRASFLAYMTDDAIVFGNEGSDNGKKVWTARPARPGLLWWDPIYADIARSGEMGYTTGPWEFRPNGPADKPVAFGEFFTVWTKQPDGTWKWILDIGISHPQREGAYPSLEYSRDFRQNTDKDKLSVNVEKVKAEILKLEGEFSNASSKNTTEAFLAYAADDIRLLREGHLPATSKANAQKTLEAAAGALTWKPTQAGAARSGELAYSYGLYEFKRAADGAGAAVVERGNYARVWKKKADGKWKVVLDLLNPFPPPPTQKTN